MEENEKREKWAYYCRFCKKSFEFVKYPIICPECNKAILRKELGKIKAIIYEII